MFRRVRCAGVLVPLLLAACGGGEVAETQTSSSSLGAAIETGSGVWIFDGNDYYMYCLGETVQYHTEAPYTYRQLSTPQGDSLYVEMWNNPGPTGWIKGNTSGKVWIRVRNVSPFLIRTMGGGMEQSTFRGSFVPEDGTGPTIEAHEMWHVSFDANQVLRVDLYSFRCWLR